MAKETMETVAFRALARQCRWMNAEARRRKVDRSELLRMLVDEKIEEARFKRERARQAVKMMRAAGDDNFAEIERRLLGVGDLPTGRLAQSRAPSAGGEVGDGE